MLIHGNPGDVPKLYHMLMWMHLSTCIVYLIPYLLLLFLLAHMHNVNVSVTKPAVCPCSCGICGGSDFLLGNIVLIQRCEVNTKKYNIVKSSVILKEAMLIYVQLDCKWH